MEVNIDSDADKQWLRIVSTIPLSQLLPDVESEILILLWPGSSGDQWWPGLMSRVPVYSTDH